MRRSTWRHKIALLTAVTTVASLSPLPAAAAPSAASASTYYIDCQRGPAGDGSDGNPWNSLKYANDRHAFQPGDSILLKRGSTCAGRLHPRGNGTSSKPIVIGAYGSRKALPTINGGGTPDATGAVQLHNQSHWTIQDLHVTNRGRAKETKLYRSGVLISNTNGGHLAGVTIRRLKIDRVVSRLSFDGRTDPREFGGISVMTTGGSTRMSGFDGLRILRNTVTGVGRTGIMVTNHQYPASADRNVRIAHNKVVRSRGDSIVLRGTRTSAIDHNVSAHGADLWPCNQCGAISPITANAGIWTAKSKNVRIAYNEVYGEHRLGGDGEGIDVDLSAVDPVVEYNYLHDNEGGGILFCGSNRAVARFNVLENNSNGAIVFIGGIPAKNSKIYNNTVYTSMQNGADVVHLQGNKGGKGIKFYNNLVYNMGWGWYHWPAAFNSSHNTVIGTHGIGEPRGNGTIFDTPILRAPGQGKTGFKSLGGYHPSSPQDDPRGIAIPVSVKKDFFGNTINPKHPPRGAAAK